MINVKNIIEKYPSPMEKEAGAFKNTLLGIAAAGSSIFPGKAMAQHISPTVQQISSAVVDSASAAKSLNQAKMGRELSKFKSKQFGAMSDSTYGKIKQMDEARIQDEFGDQMQKFQAKLDSATSKIKSGTQQVGSFSPAEREHLSITRDSLRNNNNLQGSLNIENFLRLRNDFVKSTNPLLRADAPKQAIAPIPS